LPPTVGTSSFATKEQARRKVAAFIDRYNRLRRHRSCEMRLPVEYEQLLVARAVEHANAA